LSTTRPGQTNKQVFKSLDTFRGVAALGVAWAHFMPLPGAHLAVDFFFILSGFVLSHTYTYRDNQNPIDFVVKRVARLYPLHIFTLFIYLFVWAGMSDNVTMPGGQYLGALILNLALLQNVGFFSGILGWNVPAWSISVEFWVNVVFAFCISRKTSSAFLLGTSAVLYGVLAYKFGHLYTENTNFLVFINSGLTRCVAGFFLGIICYRVYLKFKDTDIQTVYAVALQLAVLALIGALFFTRGLEKESWVDFTLVIPFAALVVIFAAAPSRLNTMIGFGAALGTISYSIYLNHFAFSRVFYRVTSRNDLDFTLMLPIYLGVVCIYSAITYRYIELPSKNFILDWWYGRRKTAIPQT